jgi:hypothetical protein
MRSENESGPGGLMPVSTGDERWFLPRQLAGLALDYLRWTQLLPMVAGWTFFGLMIAALLVTNFQDVAMPLTGRVLLLAERLFGPFDGAGFGQSDESGALHFTDEDILPIVYRAWALLALAGWVLGMIWRRIFGVRPPVALRRKLIRAAVAAGIGVGLCLFAWAFGSETFQGGPIGWLALFFGAGLAVWLVSLYSLSASALIDRLHRAIGTDR